MSYGRGPEDDENAQYPPVIAGRSRSVSMSGEFPLSTQPHGEQTLHKQVHPYASQDYGIFLI